MKIPLTHPGDSALQRFTDGESSAAERERIARHLESCVECRGHVTSIREIVAKARQLDAPRAPQALIDRVIAERAAGARTILPVVDARPASFHISVWMSAAAALLVIIGSAAALHFRSAEPIVARAIFGSTIFLPDVASAGEPDRPGRALPPPAEFDGTKLVPVSLSYERIWKPRNGTPATTGRSTLRLELGTLHGEEVLRIERLWNGSVKADGSGQKQIEAESVMVARKDLRPIKRAVHAFPYEKYDRINVFQQFTGDRIDGQMTSAGAESRGVSRDFAQRLPEDRGPFISEAFAPVLLRAAAVDSAWSGRFSVLGWAVRSDDVFYPIEMSVTGSEKITVPAGTFDCWRLTIRVGGKAYSYWARKTDGVGILSRDDNNSATKGVRDIVLVSESR